MLYVIYAADNIYQGSHGICSWSICDCYDETEACDIGFEDSFNIINSYNCIYEELEDTIQSYIDDNMLQDDIDELRNDIYLGDVVYDIWKIDMNKVKDFDIDDLEKELYNDPEEFIEKYCKRE